MELIRKIIGDASISNHFANKDFGSFFPVEVKLLILLMLSGAVFAPKFSDVILIDNLASIKSLSTDVNSEVKLTPLEKVNVQSMVSKTMSYSYGDTQLGFYLKNLTFFDLNSKQAAEEKILESLPRYLSKKAKNYVRAVLKISEKHQVDPIWILSVMWTESNFDFTAKSWAGARGLMQIMPDTRKFIYKVYKSNGNELIVEGKNFNVSEYFPFKVTELDKQQHVQKLVNIELGVIYLKSLLSSFKSHKYATVAYNMGPGWTRGRLKRNLPVGQDNQYLDKVRKAYKHLVQKI